ncbi:hypothetical protein PYCC9005_005268 [Savitreella phatthalungensis]
MATERTPVGERAAQATFQKKRVAVVGGGVAGLACVWALNEHSEHDVVLFEENDYVGGHTHTVPFTTDGQTTPVDSGFIVANTATYPTLLAFFREVGVVLDETEMSFSVSRNAGAFEWSGSGLTQLFAQASNLLNPELYRMAYDIFRFNQYATDILDARGGAADRKLTIGQYLDKHHYSKSFRCNYLVPMTACIWSTKPDKVSLDFPALTLIRFLYNHHLLQLVGRPPWLTVQGGAKTYVDRILSKLPEHAVQVKSPVREVYRADGKVYVKYGTSFAQEEFDHIVFATHADTTLSILGSQATPAERDVLSQFEFNKNRVVLHNDLDLMPRRRAAWTSWNYLTKSSNEGGKDQDVDQVCLTYCMNILQHIPESRYGPVLVTLNPLFEPRAESVQGHWAYEHPAFTPQSVAAQNRLAEIQNVEGLHTSFAGAWTKYGFHEDGFSSGLAVAEHHLGAHAPVKFIDSTMSRGEFRSIEPIDRVARLAFAACECSRAILSEILPRVPGFGALGSALGWLRKRIEALDRQSSSTGMQTYSAAMVAKCSTAKVD